MTTICAACTAPMGDDAVICRTCVGLLIKALAETPALVSDVEIMLARQATRIDVMGGRERELEEARTLDSPALGVHAQRLPYDGGASLALGNLRSVLVSWVRLVAEERPESLLPRDRLPDMARYLHHRAEWLRHHEAAAEALDEISEAVDDLRGAADRHIERWYVGDCGADDCREAIYCPAGSTHAECPTCHTVHDVTQRRDQMLDQLREMRATAEECVLAAAHAGRKVNAARIRQWAKRGRILVHGVNANGQPTYRVQEVLDMLDEADATRDAG